MIEDRKDGSEMVLEMRKIIDKQEKRGSGKEKDYREVEGKKVKEKRVKEKGVEEKRVKYVNKNEKQINSSVLLCWLRKEIVNIILLINQIFSFPCI